VVYFAVGGAVPGSRKSCVYKVSGDAATGQGGNFFVTSCQGN